VTVDHRSSIRELVERDSFQRAVMVVIVFNAITLGLETSATLMAGYGPGCWRRYRGWRPSRHCCR
jgi:voltage-gated sodium channel